MKRLTLPLLLMTAASLAVPAVARAADVSEEETTPRTRKIYLEPEKNLLERGKLNVLAAVTFGYDDNAHLNSNRDHDVYTQQFVRTAYTTPIDKRTQANIVYDLMNLMYSDETDLNLIRNTLTAGYDYAINKDWIVSPVYSFDAINYTRSGDDDWIEHSAGVKLKNRLPNKMYHTFAYSLAWRDFLNDNITITPGVDSDKRRNDWRNTVEYEIGRYFEKDWLKGFLQYYYNDSNEKYQNYFDYDSYKLGASLTHLFNDKVSGYLSGYWQKRFFRTRTLVNDTGSKEHDSTYVGIASVYYQFTKSLTAGVSYTYRQNESNEPTEAYSGSLVSTSVYYRF